MKTIELQHVIDAAWERRAEINPQTEGHVLEAVHEALDALDRGEVRVAEKRDGKWETNQWLKKAVLLSFRLMESELITGGGTYPHFGEAALVRQGAVEVRRLGCGKVSHRGLPRCAQLHRAAQRLCRAGRHPDAELPQCRRQGR